jgi:hypothetical protein
MASQEIAPGRRSTNDVLLICGRPSGEFRIALRPRRFLLLAAIVCAAPTRAIVSAADAALEVAEMKLEAQLSFTAPQATGRIEIRWRNATAAPVRRADVLLFANRFGAIDDLDDLAKHSLLAGGTFRPGGTEIVGVFEAGKPLGWSFVDRPGYAANSVAAIDLGRELATGEDARVAIEFRTRLPNLLDVFGASEDLVVADGGWYPQPLADGCAPHRTALRADVAPAPGATLLLNGKPSAGDGAVEISGDERVSVVMTRRSMALRSWRVGERSVRLYSVPSHELAHRISNDESPEDALAAALSAVLAESKPRRDVVVVRLPLRWYPSAVAPGMVLVSDRLFELFPILRPLHQRELAYALFLAEERAEARAREPSADVGWVAEGLAWRRADRLYRDRFRSGREVRDWIRLFDVFAIVDRFETAPRIPFVRPFFPVSASDDPLQLRVAGVCEPRPPGRLLFDKLEARLRPAPFERALDGYRRGSEPMRQVLRAAGKDVDRFLEAWLRPYGAVNYGLADVERNPEGRAGASFRIVREGQARPDTVVVGLEEQSGEERTQVDLEGPSTSVTLSAASPVDAVAVDPDRRTVETRLDDNRVPPQYQLLLDSADVEVSSTEFGVSTLLVARRRYDYRKDLAVAGFYTSRGYGLDAGVQWHGGKPIDANVYRQNLFAYYSFTELDPTFENKQQPQRRTKGALGGFGLRFNSFDAFWFENPSGTHHLRLFFDGYDPVLGGDFGFVQGGGSLAYTFGLRPDTVLATQVLNGYSAATGKGPIPNQGLFSLGGFRSIRGIGAEEQLDKDIFIVRAELRHMLPWRLDWSFEDALIARRLQAKLFVDSGRVAGSSRRLYDPSGFAVGVGGGLNLFYDFMGFFPTTFYLDVATRADKAGSAQVLFGVGQPF